MSFLSPFLDVFARNQIDLEIFKEMSEGDLISTGITTYGAKKCF